MQSFKLIGLSLILFFSLACGNQADVNETENEKVVLTAEETIEEAVDETTVEDAEVNIEPVKNETQPEKAVNQPKKAVKNEKVEPLVPAEPATDMTIKMPDSERVETPQAEGQLEEKIQNGPSKPTHDAWNELLQKHVSADGKVNYAGFKKDMAALESYLGGLTRNPIQEDWSRNEKRAYWINAYNAFTIKLILDNHPVASITKLHNGKPWDVKWIQLGNKTYSLNNIENDILRPQFKDSRIHFAVNCAAKSCPPLLNRAFTADKLDSQLEQQAKAFINNSQYNKISVNEVEISKIFEWYAGDFGKIIDYLNKYSKTKINSNATVKYQEYDWALNAK